MSFPSCQKGVVMGELLFMALMGALAIIMFFISGSFPVSIIDKSGGAALFPRIVVILFLFFMAIRTVIVLRDGEARKKAFVFLEIFKGDRLIFLLGIIGYIALVKPVGFVIATSLFLAGMSNFLYFKQRDSLMTLKRNIIGISAGIAISLGMYLFFTRVLSILLPQGVLTWL